MSNLAVRDLVVEFVHDGYAVRPLDGLSFDGKEGELVVLLGPSGCGKTTLLSCLGGILTPTSGSILLGDTEVTALRGRELDDYRRHQIGFVFQAFNLIPSLTARENVAMPMVLTGHGRSEAFARADELLAVMGMSDRANHKPAKLSGGQQQRVALARGLGHRPPLLLADEPTANLDHIQAEAIIRLLRTIRSEGHLIVVSTHDARLVPIADRIVQMVPDLDDVVRGPAPRGHLLRASRCSNRATRPTSSTSSTRASSTSSGYSPTGRGVLARLGPGQYCGELGPLMGFPRSASARAGTDVVLTVLSPHEFRERMLHR